MLRVIATGCTLSIGLMAQSVGSMPSIDVKNAIHSVSAVGFSSPSFATVMQLATNAPSIYQYAPELLRYSVAVHNTDNLPVIGLCVQYVAGNTPGYFSFVHSFDHPDHPVIAPGESIVMTPVHTFNVSGQFTEAVQKEVTYRMQAMGSLPGLTGVVDSVWFRNPDGSITVQGPDASGSVRRKQEQIRAWNQLVSEINVKRDNGATKDQIVAWLNTEASADMMEAARNIPLAQRVPGPLARSAPYEHSRRNSAGVMAKLYAAGQQIVPRPTLNIRRIQ